MIKENNDGKNVKSEEKKNVKNENSKTKKKQNQINLKLIILLKILNI